MRLWALGRIWRKSEGNEENGGLCEAYVDLDIARTNEQRLKAAGEDAVAVRLAQSIEVLVFYILQNLALATSKYRRKVGGLNPIPFLPKLAA